MLSPPEATGPPFSVAEKAYVTIGVPDTGCPARPLGVYLTPDDLRGPGGTVCRDPVKFEQGVRLTEGRRQGLPTLLVNTSYGVGGCETTVNGVTVTDTVVVTPPDAVAVAVLVT